MKIMRFMRHRSSWEQNHRSPLAKDAQVIDAALDDGGRRALAEAAIHLAARIVERAEDAGSKEEHLADHERTALARFGIEASSPMPREEFLSAGPVVEGMARRARMLSEAVPLAEVAKRLGVDPSRLRQRIAQGSLLAVRRPRGRGWLIPAFQLTGDGELPHLSRVLSSATRGLSAEAVGRAFELEHEELDGAAPRDWLLRGGDPAPVQRIMAGL